MDRRTFIAASTAVVTCGSLLADEEKQVRVYYGTKNQSGSEGIYTGTMNLATGELSKPVLAAKAENPGFLAINHSKTHLYAVASGPAGQKIVSYKIDVKSGLLTELNSQEAGGANPCHVSVGPKDQYVVYANYTGGSCGMIPVADDGSLAAPSSFFQHEGGSGVNERRQGEPHPHSAKTDPSGKFILIPDLGQDKVRIYRIGKDGQSMQPNDPAYATMPPGGGPRHVSFSPDGQFMYVNNELTSAVTVFEFDENTGATKAIQTITTLPAGFDGNNSTAEVLVHPSGKFLYCSNRGHDSIASFKIHRRKGQLQATGHCSSGGNTPRNFGITPDGRFVVAANQSSDNVDVLKVDPQTGALTAAGISIKVPHCICVRFLD
tara:strand:- start:186 stop:1316 length:1131 start_codon:yes stop_codon:yes gene_type:complete